MQHRISGHFLFCSLFSMFLISTLLISCIPTITLGGEIQKNINISEIPSSHILRKVKRTTDGNMLKTNILEQEHNYTVYNLPHIETYQNNSNLSLTVNLNETKDDIANKGFFLITANFSDTPIQIQRAITLNNNTPQKNINILKSSGSNSHSGHNHSDFINTAFKISPIPQSNVKLLFSNKKKPSQQEYFDSLVPYNTEISLQKQRPSKRDFIFRIKLHSSSDLGNDQEIYAPATLYSKVEFRYNGQNMKYAFWIDDKYAKNLKKAKTYKKIIDNFISYFNPDIQGDNSLYTALYKINNRNMWGNHNLGDAAADPDSVIHIGFGDIKEEELEASGIQAYVDPKTFFTNPRLLSSKQTFSEKIIAPTIYVNIHLLENKITDQSHSLFNSNNPLNTYITLLHEMQHVYTNYAKTILPSNSSKNISGNSVDIWLNEFLSVSIEYLLSYKTSLMMTNSPTSANILYREYYKKIETNFQKSLLNSQFTNTNTNTFQSGSYKVAYLFAAYLIQNYGIEALSNLVTSKWNNKHAIFNAVQNTSAYSKLEHPPKNTNEIILAFFTSLFTSDVLQDINTPNQYKLFTYNPNTNQGRITFFSGNETEPHNILYLIIENTVYKNIAWQLQSINTTTTPIFTASNCTPEDDNSYRQSCRLQFPQTTNTDLNYTWTRQAGSYVFIPNMSHMNDSIVNTNLSRKGGQHAVIYLGGKINNSIANIAKNGSDENIGLQIKENGQLSINLKLPKGILANLVVIDYPENE